MRDRARGAGLLTSREQEIAGLLAQGLSNKAIAKSLVIAQRTAETHVANVLAKLRLTSRSQVTAWVAEQRGIDPAGLVDEFDGDAPDGFGCSVGSTLSRS